MNKIKYFWITGDIHGDYRPVYNFVNNKLETPKEETAIILLGDVGANFYCDKRDNYTKYHLNEIGVRLYCLRGNHEKRPSTCPGVNYSLVYDPVVDGMVYVEPQYPNLRFFNDKGGLYNIHGHKTLIVPGAYSVDKWYRLEHNWSWFEDEQLSPAEMDSLLEIASYVTQVDYILAHSCPLMWEGYIDDLFLGQIDQNRVDKSTEKFLDKIINKVDYKHFYFGHFHDDRDLPRVDATMLFHSFIPFGSNLKSHRQASR